MERSISTCHVGHRENSSGTIQYVFSFGVRPIEVDAPASRPVEYVLAETLSRLAGRIAAMADEIDDGLSLRQELPRMAEFDMDYDGGPFYAVRLFVESADKRGRRNRRKEVAAVS